MESRFRFCNVMLVVLLEAKEGVIAGPLTHGGCLSIFGFLWMASFTFSRRIYTFSLLLLFTPFLPVLFLHRYFFDLGNIFHYYSL